MGIAVYIVYGVSVLWQMWVVLVRTNRNELYGIKMIFCIISNDSLKKYTAICHQRLLCVGNKWRHVLYIRLRWWTIVSRAVYRWGGQPSEHWRGWTMFTTSVNVSVVHLGMTIRAVAFPIHVIVVRLVGSVTVVVCTQTLVMVLQPLYSSRFEVAVRKKPSCVFSIFFTAFCFGVCHQVGIWYRYRYGGYAYAVSVCV